MTTEQTALQRLKEVCEKATPGPWYHNDEMDDIYSETSGAVGTTADDGGAWTVHDIHAVIVMRTALPALIELCEAQAEELMLRRFECKTPMEALEYRKRIKAASAAVEAARARLEEACPK